MNSFIEGLFEAGGKAILEIVFGAVLVAGGAILARIWARRGKVRIESGSGHTCTSPYVLLVAVLCAVAAAAFLALGLVYPEALREPGELKAWAGLIGGFSFLSLVIAPFTYHTWEWNREGLSWRGAWRAVSIPWSKLARVGTSWDGRFFAASKSGKKIYWSTYTLEHEALRRAIETARPDLSFPGP
jgi:hypothetical protein